ncbi:hypothetical protein HY969_04870 [Candidatus Kaiserbacteria bacterium]|nr:hypothetical protein [Candidatus Kaiserbacteria bacterium]
MSEMGGGGGESDRNAQLKFEKNADDSIQRAQMDILRFSQRVGALLQKDTVIVSEYDAAEKASSKIRRDLKDADFGYSEALRIALIRVDTEALARVSLRIEAVLEMSSSFYQVWDTFMIELIERETPSIDQILEVGEKEVRFITDSMPLLQRQMEVLKADSRIDPKTFLATLGFHFSRYSQLLRMLAEVHVPRESEHFRRADALLSGLVLARGEVRLLADRARAEKLIPPDSSF